MEPVTHILTGACLARSGFNRRAAYATAAMAIAAEFPDIDTLWSLRGPISGFEHHRGITHTFLGLPFEAAFLVLLFWTFHHWRARRATPGQRPKQAETHAAPVRWTMLYGLILLALLSHILLDYTNNYGIRPFFPFNPHWYAASIVFIFDPLLFVFLFAGLLLPVLFGLIGQEVGARRTPFRGAGWARTALVCVVALWLVRVHEHAAAVALADGQILQAPAPEESASPSQPDPTQSASPDLSSESSRPSLPPLQSLASPDPLSIFRWYTATDFGPAYRLGTANTRVGALEPGEILTKPSPSATLQAAEQSRLGRVYLDWSAMPWITISDAAATADQAVGERTVLFEDLRFMGSSPLLQRGRTVPLSGIVVLSPSGQVVAQGMGDRFER